jgi:hypothetical protein
MNLLGKILNVFGLGSKAEAPKVEKPEGVPKADHSHVRVVTEGSFKGWVYVGVSPTTQRAFYVAASDHTVRLSPGEALDIATTAVRLPTRAELSYIFSVNDAEPLRGKFNNTSGYLAHDCVVGRDGKVRGLNTTLNTAGDELRMLYPDYPVRWVGHEPKSDKPAATPPAGPAAPAAT